MISTLNVNEENNPINTNQGKLILDSHKLSYHYDRLQDWESGKQIAPISVDMALTRACGAMCSFLLCNGSRTTRESKYKN